MCNCSTPAPVDGTTIMLASSAPGSVTVSPASVFIGPLATTPAVQPQVTGVAIGSASITASSAGYAGTSVNVSVLATISLSPQNLPVVVGGAQSIMVLLSAPAPPGGLLVNLSSSDTTVATVPSSINVTGQSAVVQVTGVAPGPATITASSISQFFTVAGPGVSVTVSAGP